MQYSVDIGQHQLLQVVSDPDGLLGQQIGNGLWTAATELVDFLRCRAQSCMHGQTVLELGAGVGLVGQVSLLRNVVHSRQRVLS